MAKAVWCGSNHEAMLSLMDFERGAGKLIQSNSSAAELPYTDVSSFNSNGFTAGFYSGWFNSASYDQCSWSFRKAEKFFDVVTYTGNGTTQSISHNLGVKPGFYVVKQTSGTGGSWYGYHSGLDSTYTNPSGIRLDSTSAAFEANSSLWNLTFPTSADFTVGTSTGVNASGETYVAYLFASDAGGFGDDDENIIKCGSYVEPNNGSFTDVDLGFEPQFIIAKCSSSGGSNWVTSDSMRGMPVGDGAAILNPNTSAAETAGFANAYFRPTATGFSAGNTFVGGGGETVIYIAIRRPMKTPESGTEVFAPVNRTATAPTYYTGFVTDMQIMTLLNGFQNQLTDRLRGQKKLLTNAGDAESAIGTEATYDWMTGVGNQDSASSNNIAWNFKRATGFFDVVAYSGTGNFPQNVTHNLTVTPEMMIVKYRDGASNWYVYHSALGNTKICQLDNDTASSTSGSSWNNTSPTATQFTVGSLHNYPVAGKYIAYLFATLAGVSKVGSYTGTAADLNVDCGFSAGARFILIKRTDSTGDWYLWDSLRGIVAGNDPYLLLNTTAAEVTNTDYIDPLSSGFTVTSSASSTVNVSSGSYIFLAIA